MLQRSAVSAVKPQEGEAWPRASATTLTKRAEHSIPGRDLPTARRQQLPDAPRELVVPGGPLGLVTAAICIAGPHAGWLVGHLG